MKKFISFLLVLILSISLCSCAGAGKYAKEYAAADTLLKSFEIKHFPYYATGNYNSSANTYTVTLETCSSSDAATWVKAAFGEKSKAYISQVTSDMDSTNFFALQSMAKIIYNKLSEDTFKETEIRIVIQHKSRSGKITDITNLIK